LTKFEEIIHSGGPRWGRLWRRGGRGVTGYQTDGKRKVAVPRRIDGSTGGNSIRRPRKKS